MTRWLIEFAKTTIAGGLFILLPLLLLWIMLDEILALIVALATPIADLFPPHMFEDLNMPALVAILLIVGVSFLLGIVARVEIGRSVGTWFERNTLGRLPLYLALKRLTAQLVSINEETSFKPALLIGGTSGDDLCYLVEELGDGRVAILLPWSPTAFAGSVKIVPADRIRILKTSLGDISRVLSHWGVGARELLAQSGELSR